MLPNEDWFSKGFRIIHNSSDQTVTLDTYDPLSKEETEWVFLESEWVIFKCAMQEEILKNAMQKEN